MEVGDGGSRVKTLTDDIKLNKETLQTTKKKQQKKNQNIRARAEAPLMSRVR